MTPEEATARFYKHVWPHRALILRTACLLTRSTARAEDLAQETFMRAFSKMDQFDVFTTAVPWLMTILRNVQIDQVRVKSHAILTQARELDAEVPAGREILEERNPCDPVDLLEQFSDQTIIDALHLLPEEICWTLLLIDVQQISYEEAARILDVPAGTVKSRAHRGRQMLRDQLLGASAAEMPRHILGRKAQGRIS
jgi:RNA polymerase sigma-70 factor (ECF subfamily)